MKDSIDFTDRERFVLSYYRDTKRARWQLYALYESALVVASLFFLTLAVVQHDRVWGFVAYAVLLWRICASVWRARQYMASFRSIIMKYDAKIVELATAKV